MKLNDAKTIERKLWVKGIPATEKWLEQEATAGRIPSVDVNGRRLFDTDAVLNALSTKAKFNIADYTFESQTAAVLGLTDFIAGTCKPEDITEAERLHIVTATELKHRIESVVKDATEQGEIDKAVHHFSYLYGIYSGISYRQRQGGKDA